MIAWQCTPERRHVDGRALHRAVRQFVIQRAGENSRGGGFADPAHAGQNPGLRNAAGLERVRDGADHGVLADQIVETGGTVFARQHAVVLAGLRRSAQIEAALMGARRDRRGTSRKRQRQSSIDPQLIVSRSRLAERKRNQAQDG